MASWWKRSGKLLNPSEEDKKLFKMLEKLRKQIDKIDRQIFKLIIKRTKIGMKAALYKKSRKLPLFDKKRENEILKRFEGS